MSIRSGTTVWLDGWMDNNWHFRWKNLKFHIQILLVLIIIQINWICLQPSSTIMMAPVHNMLLNPSSNCCERSPHVVLYQCVEWWGVMESLPSLVKASKLEESKQEKKWHKWVDIVGGEQQIDPIAGDCAQKYSASAFLICAGLQWFRKFLFCCFMKFRLSSGICAEAWGEMGHSSSKETEKVGQGLKKDKQRHITEKYCRGGYQRN